MPLNPQTLTEKLLKIDDPQSPKTPQEVCDKWCDAWWTYQSGMSLYASADLAKSLAVPAFKGIFLPGVSVPVPIPLSFFTALDAAIRAALVVSGTPVTLTPPATAITPPPAPLAPLLMAVVPVGMLSPIKAPPRALMATVIHTWTMTGQVVFPGGPSPML